MTVSVSSPYVGVPGGLLLPDDYRFHCGLLIIWMGIFLDGPMRSLFFCVALSRRWMNKGDASFPVYPALSPLQFWQGEGLYSGNLHHIISYQ